MPLFVTNLTDIDINYRRITSADSAMGLHFNQPIDRVWDTAYAMPAQIRELLEGHSGVVTGYFDPHPSSVTVNGYRYFDDVEAEPVRSARLSGSRLFRGSHSLPGAHQARGLQHVGLGDFTGQGSARCQGAGPGVPQQLSEPDRK